MRYRKLSPTGDYTFGHGQADFYRDVPEAPAQAVKTRLHLQLGEWFLDSSEGTPWKTRVLGKYTGSTRDPVIRTRILGSQGVTGIAEYSSALNRDTRGFSVNCTIDTQYGAAVVSETM